jgi:cellulose 1,4-beta-cellobiosidase
MFILFLLGLIYSLGTRTKQAEDHLSLSCQSCRSGRSCEQTSGSVLLDSKLKLAHNSSLTNCYDDNECSSSLCPDSKTYSNNCVIEGADYSGTYDITTSVNSLKLVFVTNGSCSTNIGSRIYLLMDETNYQIFILKSKEFKFTVDDSNLGCGLNGTLYFFSMDEDG